MNPSIDLSLEQEFNLRIFADQVQGMSLEQAQDFLVMMYQEMMLKEKMYQELIKQNWGLEPAPWVV